MIILFITRKKTAGPKDAAQESFAKHDEAMRKFRAGHPDLNVPRPRDFLTSDGNLLAPVEKVILGENLQN